MITLNSANAPLDVLVIGAGQAGLALGYHLRRTGLRFLLVERHGRVGESWRRRFDSLTLFTPRAYSALPGLRVPGEPEGYATKDEIADYLEHYAEHFALPVALDTGIDRLEHVAGLFRATTTSGRTIAARAVVLATGAFQQSAIPPVADQLADDVVQLTSDMYRNPQQVPAGTVLVVGDGATGRQIASELGESHRVLLSTGRPRRVSPHRILGKSLFWWMDTLGILRLSRETAVGRYLMRADPFPGKHLALGRLRKRGITVVGRLAGAVGRRVMFADREVVEIDAVIWATGYRDETGWVAIPEAVDARGAFIERRGISPVPNLTFIGRSWQWSRGSALLTGVGADAADVAQRLVQSLTTTSGTGRQPASPASATTGAPASRGLA